MVSEEYIWRRQQLLDSLEVTEILYVMVIIWNPVQKILPQLMNKLKSFAYIV